LNRSEKCRDVADPLDAVRSDETSRGESGEHCGQDRPEDQGVSGQEVYEQARPQDLAGEDDEPRREGYDDGHASQRNASWSDGGTSERFVRLVGPGHPPSEGAPEVVKPESRQREK
jgi:hypothetical protein